MQTSNYTPMMKQYIDTKKKYPEGILLFRAGDFYEMFYDDAKLASSILNITLTRRGKGATQAPLAGIPYHSIDPYIAKLIKAGKKVVICDQVEDPKQAKGLVKRDVTRIITPSTFFSDSYDNNFLCSIAYHKGVYGFSLIDITTGEFKTISFDFFSSLLTELSLNKPKELLLTKNILSNISLLEAIKKEAPSTILNYTENLDVELSYNELCAHFKLPTLIKFGINNFNEKPEISISAYNALNYLKQTQFSKLDYIDKIKAYPLNKFLKIDRKTVKNLEMVSTLQNATSIKNSLFHLINNTNTPMGYRKLYYDITHPILDKTQINKIYDSVEELYNNQFILNEFKLHLSYIKDIERIVSKIGFGNVTPRDLISLKESIFVLPKIKLILKECTAYNLLKIYNQLNTLDEVYNLIHHTIVQEPPFTTREGKFINPNFSKELSDLVNIHKVTNTWLVEFEASLKNQTNIKSLKVKYNKILGYYIEIPKNQTKDVPDFFERKQTLVNAERFTTKELSEKEDIVLHATEKRIELENSIFITLYNKINTYKEDISQTAMLIADLDVYVSHAITSINNNYFRPKLSEQDIIYFKDLRHPIIEKVVNFIPNDCNLNKDIKTMIITGPNMSGKSSYMRSVCLALVLAHIGCFVPAQESKIGFVDAIFTRVGASDDILHGQSTFLVEMSEVSYILNNSTKNSFVILDEVGRGTSTFDGLSLAWAIIDYLNNTVGCKTLVATHYHILNKMELLFTGIKNYHVTAKEEGNNLLFFHKLVEGGINKSYGIQVAKIAGVPQEVIANALNIQKELEQDIFLKDKFKEQEKTNSGQKKLF